MSNWKLNYSHGDEWEWYHQEHPTHRLLVAQAGPDCEEDWYALPYIGGLAPDDHRYRGADRRVFYHVHDAQTWADQYLAAHPDGHNWDELEAAQQQYRVETGTVEPLH